MTSPISTYRAAPWFYTTTVVAFSKLCAVYDEKYDTIASKNSAECTFD